MTSPPLTRTIGITERTLRELLERRLAAAGISFPEWTVLVFLGAGDLTAADIAGRLAGGKIVAADKAPDLLARMGDAGLIEEDGAKHIALTDKGRQTFASLSDAIAAITSSLVDGIAEADLDATRRTLDAIALRAGRLLAA